MKKIVRGKGSLLTLLAIIVSLTATPLWAHSGHLADDSVHGFLHVEHIFILLAIGLALYLVKAFRSK